MIQDFIKGKHIKDVENNILNANHLSTSDITNMFKYKMGLTLCKLLVKINFSDDKLSTILDSLMYYDDNYTIPIFNIVLSKQDYVDKINWKYYYHEYIHNNRIFLSKILLEKKLVDIKYKEYEILHNLCLKHDLKSFKELIEKYDLTQMLSTNNHLFIGSYMYDREIFDYILSLVDINNNELLLSKIADSSMSINIIKYLNDKLTNYEIIYKYAVMYDKRDLLSYLIEIFGKPTDIKNLIRIANSYDNKEVVNLLTKHI